MDPELTRRIATQGAKARAKSQTKKRRRDIAVQAAKTRWDRYYERMAAEAERVGY